MTKEFDKVPYNSALSSMAKTIGLIGTINYVYANADIAKEAVTPHSYEEKENTQEPSVDAIKAVADLVPFAVITGVFAYAGVIKNRKNMETYTTAYNKTADQYKDDLFEQTQQNDLLARVVSKVEGCLDADLRTKTGLPVVRALRSKAAGNLVANYIVDSNFDLLKLQQLEGVTISTFAQTLAATLIENTQKREGEYTVTFPTQQVFNQACDQALAGNILALRRENGVANPLAAVEAGEARQPMEVGDGNAVARGWTMTEVISRLCGNGRGFAQL